ncbi:sugar transferase [Waterburya agarophytonicola]|nr:sugar transferase [Waterburya agarophytonicola]
MLHSSKKSRLNSSSRKVLELKFPVQDIRSAKNYSFLIKRIFDVVVASSMLIVLALPMLVVMAAIKLDSTGSVFFSQPRIGLGGKEFNLLKLRTMVENASNMQVDLESNNEVEGGVLFKIKDDPRITKVGKYLRRYSVDEIPQLINVIKGEMSLVGPRPLTLRDSSKLSPEKFSRYQVLPGITGMWQVYGRSDSSSKQLHLYDRFYINRWSLLLDFTIVIKTVLVVVAGRGAY